MTDADTRIRDTSVALLDGVASGLASAGLVVPDRQYITTGRVSVDYTEDGCGEALVVSWVGMLNAPAGGQIVKCAVPFTGRFGIGLFRCVPTLNEDNFAPPADDLNASGEALSIDAMTLAAMLVDKKMSGELFTTCKIMGISDVTPFGPEGGVGGSLVTVTVELISG